MKYIITDRGEVRTGTDHHRILSSDCYGRVVSAGHFRETDDGVKVFGQSYGFGIYAKDEDAVILAKCLKSKNTSV